ncbi:MAG: HAD family hydrolase [Bulleidia sp.]
MAIRLILLDIDNTLLEFDGYVHEFIKETLAPFSKSGYRKEMQDTFDEVNHELWKQLEEGKLTFPQLKKVRWQMILDRLGIDQSGEYMEELFRQNLHESTIITEGAMEMLAELSKHHIVCSASNGPYEQQVYRLNKAGMGKYFTAHFISEDIGCSKPDTGFFEEAMRRIREITKEEITKDEIVIIGDSMSSDMEGGLRYGCHTCFFDRNNTGKTGKTDWQVHSLQEITEYVKEHNG